jgi:hypothetical protein
MHLRDRLTAIMKYYYPHCFPEAAKRLQQAGVSGVQGLIYSCSKTMRPIAQINFWTLALTFAATAETIAIISLWWLSQHSVIQQCSEYADGVLKAMLIEKNSCRMVAIVLS